MFSTTLSTDSHSSPPWPCAAPSGLPTAAADASQPPLAPAPLPHGHLSPIATAAQRHYCTLWRRQDSRKS